MIMEKLWIRISIHHHPITKTKIRKNTNENETRQIVVVGCQGGIHKTREKRGLVGTETEIFDGKVAMYVENWRERGMIGLKRGQFMKQVTYKEGKEDGEWKGFYENRKICCQGSFTKRSTQRSMGMVDGGWSTNGSVVTHRKIFIIS